MVLFGNLGFSHAGGVSQWNNPLDSVWISNVKTSILRLQSLGSHGEFTDPLRFLIRIYQGTLEFKFESPKDYNLLLRCTLKNFEDERPLLKFQAPLLKFQAPLQYVSIHVFVIVALSGCAQSRQESKPKQKKASTRLSLLIMIISS